MYKKGLHKDRWFKSYSELVRHIREPDFTKETRKKKKQLEEWKCHFNYEQKGRKFKILEVYDKPITIIKEHKDIDNEITGEFFL